MSILDLKSDKKDIFDFINNQSGDSLTINGKVELLDPNIYQKLSDLKFKKVKIDITSSSKNDKLKDFIMFILTFPISCDYLQVVKSLEYNKINKCMRFSIGCNFNFQKPKVEVKEIENIKIVFKKQGSQYELKKLIPYLTSFPNLNQLILDLTKVRYIQDDIIQPSEFQQLLKPLEYVGDIQIVQKQFNITKKNKEIKVRQIVSTQKHKLEAIKPTDGSKYIQQIKRVIDLTNKENLNKEILKQGSEDNEILDQVKIMKLYGNQAYFNGAKNLLEKFKKINTIIALFKDENQEDKQQLIYQGFKQMSTSIVSLKHFEFQDKAQFLKRHNKLIKILLEQHQGFKVTYQFKGSQLQYNPTQRYLQIKSTENYELSNEDILETFRLYNNTKKICIFGDYKLIQYVVNILIQFPNITCVKLTCVFDAKQQIDFSPLYPKKELFKIKFFHNNNTQPLDLILYFKSIQSLCSHPTCSVIKGKDFTFSNSSKQAIIKIKDEAHEELFEKTIWRFNEINKITILTPIDNLDYIFISKIISLPCLSTVQLGKFPYLNYEKQSKLQLLPFEILQKIKAQKLSIFSIKKYLSQFIPVYLPQIMYDLYS